MNILANRYNYVCVEN